MARALWSNSATKPASSAPLFRLSRLIAVFSFSKGLPLQIRASSGLDVLSFSTDKRRQIRSKISFKGVVPNNVCVWTAVICCDSVLQHRHVSESLIQFGGPGAPVGEQNYA